MIDDPLFLRTDSRIRSNRRTFIKQTLLVSAFSGMHLGGTGCDSNEAMGNIEETIVIIGAGAAGLGAAGALMRRGYTSVTILEARDRIGGRIWTSSAWPNAPIDLGASWIHGVRSNPLTGLADKVGSVRLPTDYENVTAYQPDGAQVDDATWVRIERWVEEMHRVVNKNATSQRSLQSIIDEIAQGQSQEDRVLIDYIVNTYVEQDWAADARELSSEALEYGEEFGGGDVLFPKGYIQLFEEDARQLDIRFGHQVEQVAYDTTGVYIRTNQGTVTADRVIITLPLGVLKRETVEFVPALSDAKRAAIQTLGMGVLNKTCLHFPNVFWERDVEAISYISPRAGMWSDWLNMVVYTGRPILIGFNAGDIAREVEAWDDQSIVASAMDVLRTLYGSAIPEPETYQVTRWASDPFSWGSYSFLSVGSSAATYDALATPVADRLFFAGEATNRDHPSTVHGAFMSGEREAERVARV